MTNVYWPVFQNLEQIAARLTRDIHICDEQLDVYSSSITDLILRAVAEIESISKSLYKRHNGPKEGQIRFDHEALKFLNQQWNLEEKVAIVSHHNCFQTEKLIFPFRKRTERSGSGKNTYEWNNAYQNLKHDREAKFNYGSLRHLFSSLSALYILNIYYRDETFDLGKVSNAQSFSANVGSDIFAVEVAANAGHGPNGEYIHPENFSRAVYYTNHTQETHDIFWESVREYNRVLSEFTFSNPAIVKYISEHDMSKFEGNIVQEVLGNEGFISLLRQADAVVKIEGEQLRHEAIVNKNQL
jgi:hypothetical protein